MDIRDKVAIVTGAGAGFGKAMAQALVQAGARVVLADIRQQEAHDAAETLGPRAAALHVDVSSKASVDSLVAHTVERFGVPDIVVNNAGISHRNSPLTSLDEASFDRLFAVNVKSIYNMAMAAAPLMRDHGGGVMINVGSVAGIRPRPGLAWYNASKGAVNSMSRALAIELAAWKIRVNVICPVLGETAMLRDFIGEDTPENRAKFLATIPLGRFAQPEDVAAAALYLIGSDFTTGVELPVDGGRLI